MRKPVKPKRESGGDYNSVFGDVANIIETARQSAVRSVNCIMTAAYWKIGRCIVEYEQGGKQRAGYGEQLLERLSKDLMSHFGRGFGVDNLDQAVAELAQRGVIPIESSARSGILGWRVADLETEDSLGVRFHLTQAD